MHMLYCLMLEFFLTTSPQLRLLHQSAAYCFLPQTPYFSPMKARSCRLRTARGDGKAVVLRDDDGEVYRELGNEGGDEIVGGTSVGELGSPEMFSGIGSVSLSAGVDVSGSM